MDKLQLLIDRYNKKTDWTVSRLFINGDQHGYAIEDEVRNQSKKVHGETAISAGSYKLGLRQSPRFSKTFYYSDSLNQLITSAQYKALSDKKDFRLHDLIWVLDVPNFQYILIHWGNTDDDSDGCIIVGSQLGIVNKQEAVINSRTFYQKIYPLIYPQIKNGQGTITIL